MLKVYTHTYTQTRTQREKTEQNQHVDENPFQNPPFHDLMMIIKNL